MPSNAYKITIYLISYVTFSLNLGGYPELESSLISERVKAGMAIAKTKGKNIGRPKTPKNLIDKIETLASTTNFSINMIKKEIDSKVSRAVIGKIVKKVRNNFNY